ncbi:MAG TPA: hypothetical protein DIT25_00305 [Candidatus Moranbacteria bacterium]|nr:hypothetical protein [Candidatus Moranbacteria bacterium]
MHDFLLAKEIVDELLRIAKENPECSGGKISEADIEIGMITLAHDGFEEHAEDINIENLEFGLKSIAKDTILKETKFNIKKTQGDSWKITKISA